MIQTESIGKLSNLNFQWTKTFRLKCYVFLNLSLHGEEDSVRRKLICVHGVQYKFKVAAILT